jgi:hypothetical protein
MNSSYQVLIIFLWHGSIGIVEEFSEEWGFRGVSGKFTCFSQIYLSTVFLEILGICSIDIVRDEYREFEALYKI